MKDLKYYEVNNKVQHESSYLNRNDSQYHNVSVVAHDKIIKTRNKLKNNTRKYAPQPSIIFHLSNFGSSRNRKHITRLVSMPEITRGNRSKKKSRRRIQSSSEIKCWKTKFCYGTKYVVSERRFKCSSNHFNFTKQTNFKVYRCQVAPGVAKDCHKCCCSCNSDVLFEVMKDLYDCYKGRDCENCNCILCCNLPEHEREGLAKKSTPSIGLESALKQLAMKGFPLPEGKTASEKMLIDKIRYNLGLPPEPKNDAMRSKYTNAANAGLMLPLEKKTPPEKEKILQGLANMGIPLPEGRTPSEKSLIAKIQAGTGTPLTTLSPSEKMRKAKSAGLLTPFEGKSPDRIEKILRGLAMQGIPLPKGKTPSKKKLIAKVRGDLGLPPEPKTSEMLDKHKKAAKVGFLLPLEGKSPSQKEKILQGLNNMGIPLPVGRTPSEKSLIAKVKAQSKVPPITSSEKLKERKSPVPVPKGVYTPLEGKTPAQKEAILKETAMKGIPLPDGRTDSEKKLMKKIRNDLGLPPEPKTPSMKEKHAKAAEAGVLLPLEGKPSKEKERILRGLADMRIPLPKGRTPSEKARISKVKLETREPFISPEKMRKAKAAGFLTPLEGKTPEQKEKILRGLAMHGIPLPEGKTKSEKDLINKVRAELGLPPEPKTPSMKEKHARAADAGTLLPLEGKSPKEKEKILQGFLESGIPLPEGRTPSEKALIAKVKAQSKVPPITSSEKLKERKSPVPVPKGVYTPLEGKTPAQKEAILKEIAMKGVPLPDGRTDSEKQLMKKIRYDLGLPPDPKTPSMKEKHAKAAEAGVLLPLEGKPSKEKERILRGLADMRIPLPKGRTPSEKARISKVKLETREPFISPEKMRKAKAAGFLTPLEGKTPEQKEKILRGLAMHGIPLPEGKTKSEKDLINKVRAELGLPPEPKTPSMKEKHVRAADAGILLPLEGKSPKEKEKILRGYLESGIPLPEGRTPSEKALIAKVKARGPVLPPTGMSEERLRKAKAAGLLTPLAGKPPKEKERILRNLAKAGLPLPLAKTPSEIPLINKVKKEFGIVEDTPEEKIRKAKAAGFLTPLEGKTPEQREAILRGRAAAGLPLPVGTSPSERELIKKIKASTGYVTPSPSERLRKAEAAGLLTPLKGKTPSTKERILKDMLAAGVPIPDGTTPSEKEIIRKVIAPQVHKSKKLKAAKAAGLLTPLAGKTNEQKENILKGLAKMGLPLPMPNTPSERNLVDKVRADLGLPPEPKSRSLRERYGKAHDAGIMTPLEGKSPEDKEKILRRLQSAGIPLPIGRTRSEKAMVKRIKAGLLASPKTPFDEMTPEEKEKRLKHLIKLGKPLPDAKTPSGKALVEKVRKDLGLPPAAKSESMKIKMNKAHAAGLITPLEGKNDLQKSKILTRLAKAGIPLPEGRTPSEKAMIRKIQSKYKKRPPGAPVSLPSEMVTKAKDLGLLTPLAGKPPAEKERILRGLAEQGIPLPEAITPSEKMLTGKIRKEMGLPPEPITASMKERHNMAAAEGILVPLEGLNEPDKIKHLRDLADAGITLPEGRTASEKILVDLVNEETGKEMHKLESKITGIITPLRGKTPEEQENILRGLAEAGLPMPKGETRSERSLIRKIRAEFGIPSHATTATQKDMIRKAKAKGLFTPLAGKKTAEKERIIRGLAEAGLPLPEGKTATERDIIKRVKSEFKGTLVSEELRVSRKTCERACGCGTKKIKFKHSYVKISILSPDISNICPCPNECIPGVKGGLFAGGKGINVVIERAIGVPLYSTKYINTAPDYNEFKANNTLSNTSTTAIKILFNKNRDSYNFRKSTFKRHNLRSGPGSCNINYIIDTPYFHTSVSDKCTNALASICPYHKMPPNIVGTHSSPSSGTYDISSNYTIASDSYRGSLASIFVKSDTSLSFNSSSEVVNTDSIILYADDLPTSNVTPYTNTSSDFDLSKDSIENLVIHSNEDEYYSGDTIARSSHNFTDQATLNDETNENNVIYNRKKRDDDLQVFQMSQRKQVNVSETHSNHKLKTKTGQPVVVINQLNSEIDVSAVVDEILLNKEFCNTSSVFVIVPISDDEDDQINYTSHKDATAKCFQLSNNYNKWNCTDEEELCMPHRKTTTNTTGLRVSAKGRRFFLEGVPAAAVTPNNKETVYNYVPCKKLGATGNKFCQMSSRDTIVQKSHIVSTDTTQDRPCCCKPGQTVSLESMESYKERCIMNIVSEILTPLLNTQESNILTQLQNTNIEQEIHESKFMQLNPSTTSVSVCQIPPCLKVRRSCHFADQSDQYQDADRSLRAPLLEIKKLLEQQSPEVIKQLCDQIRSGKLKRRKDTGTDCVQKIPVNVPPGQISPRHSPPVQMPPVHMPPGHMPPGHMPPGHMPPGHMPPGHMPPGHMPPVQMPNVQMPNVKMPNVQMPNVKMPNVQMPNVKMPPVQMPPIQMPPGFLPPAPENLTFPRRDEICPGCFKPKYKEGKVLNCDCGGTKKKVRLRPLCPCEQHQWPMSKILYGPKPGTRSLGCQCCMCDDSPTKGPRGQIIPRLGATAPDIYGPPVSTGIQFGSGSIICPKGGPCRFSDGTPVIPQPLPMGFYGQPNIDREMGQIDIYGPAGGYALMGPGGTHTQAGMRQTRYSDGVGTDWGNVGAEPSRGKKKNCACAERKGNGKGKKKGKGKVICECPPEPEPPETTPGTTPGTPPSPPGGGAPGGGAGAPPPVSLPHGEPGAGLFPELGDIEPDAQNLHYLEYYGDYLKNRIEKHRKKMQAMKSDLTQTTSGFNVKKKEKKKPKPDVDSSDDSDVTVEDAIRYYALTNPELLRELLPPEMIRQAKEECVCEDAKSVNTEKYFDKNFTCECPEEPLTEEQRAAAVLAKAAEAVLPGEAGAVPGSVGVGRGPAGPGLGPPGAGPGPAGAGPGPADLNLPEDEGVLPKGFKIRMPGKGSGSKGLAGICCFDMIQERRILE